MLSFDHEVISNSCSDISCRLFHDWIKAVCLVGDISDIVIYHTVIQETATQGLFYFCNIFSFC